MSGGVSALSHFDEGRISAPASVRMEGMELFGGLLLLIAALVGSAMIVAAMWTIVRRLTGLHEADSIGKAIVFLIFGAVLTAPLAVTIWFVGGWMDSAEEIRRDPPRILPTASGTASTSSTPPTR